MVYKAKVQSTSGKRCDVTEMVSPSPQGVHSSCSFYIPLSTSLSWFNREGNMASPWIVLLSVYESGLYLYLPFIILRLVSQLTLCWQGLHADARHVAV